MLGLLRLLLRFARLLLRLGRRLLLWPAALAAAWTQRDALAAAARRAVGALRGPGDESTAPPMSVASPTPTPADAAPQAAATSETPSTPSRDGGDGSAAVPEGAVPGDGTAECPPDFPIKGNAGSMIYHQPDQPTYARTIAEYCFATAEAAEAAGYRPPRR